MNPEIISKIISEQNEIKNVIDFKLNNQYKNLPLMVGPNTPKKILFDVQYIDKIYNHLNEIVIDFDKYKTHTDGELENIKSKVCKFRGIVVAASTLTIIITFFTIFIK